MLLQLLFYLSTLSPLQLLSAALRSILCQITMSVTPLASLHGPGRLKNPWRRLCHGSDWLYLLVSFIVLSTLFSLNVFVVGLSMSLYLLSLPCLWALYLRFAAAAVSPIMVQEHRHRGAQWPPGSGTNLTSSHLISFLIPHFRLLCFKLCAIVSDQSSSSRVCL